MSKETAEQKLLKLIEATEAASGGAPSDNPFAAMAKPNPEAQQTLASVQSIGVSSIPVPAFVANLLHFFQNPALALKSPQQMGVRELNRLLLAVIVLFGFYFFSVFTKGMKSSQRDFDFAAVGARAMKTELVNVADKVKDLSEYVATAAHRNIFQPVEKKKAEVAAAVEEEAPAVNQAVTDKVSTLKVVGISWQASKETVTVMIEDTQTQVTHFLKAGDQYQGLKIEKIYSDHVDVSFQGQTTSMSL